MKIKHKQLLVCLTICIFSGSSLAQNKQIIEEVFHTFTVSKLNPSVVLIGSNAIVPSEGAAEKHLQSWLTAMKQSPYSEVMNYWDSDSRRKLRELDVRVNKSSNQWEQEWRRLIGSATVVATNKIIYGKYELFTLEIKNNTNLIKETVALYQDDGKWRLTNELTENVVFNKWDSDQSRIQRLANPLYKKIQSK